VDAADLLAAWVPGTVVTRGTLQRSLIADTLLLPPSFLWTQGELSCNLKPIERGPAMLPANMRILAVSAFNATSPKSAGFGTNHFCVPG
jgi:hypothetical protein